MKKRTFSLLAALALLLGAFHLTAFAKEPLDTNKKGTITVAPQANFGDIDGDVTLYKVADISAVGNRSEFVLTDDFAGSHTSLDDIESPELAVSLAVYASIYSVEGKTQVLDSTNKAVFDVYPGLYLVVHTGAEEGKNTFVPFLVVFPGTENGEYVYHIIVAPKTGPLPEIPDWPDVPDIPDQPTEPDIPTVPDESQPGETLPNETQPEETQPDVTTPDETKPDATVPESTAPDETTPSETRPTPTTPEEEEKLPQTGQLNWPVPMLALLGLCLVVTGLILRFRSRKEDHEA